MRRSQGTFRDKGALRNLSCSNDNLAESLSDRRTLHEPLTRCFDIFRVLRGSGLEFSSSAQVCFSALSRNRRDLSHASFAAASLYVAGFVSLKNACGAPG